MGSSHPDQGATGGPYPTRDAQRPMPLLNDICRCHDADCPEHLDCRRWLERESGPRLMSEQSLYPPELCAIYPPGLHGPPCPNRIPPNGYHSVALD